MKPSWQRTLYLVSAPEVQAFDQPLPPFTSKRLRDWTELVSASSEIHPADVVLLDPYADDPAKPSARLWELLRSRPSLTVAVVVNLTPARRDDVVQMLEWGVCEVLSPWLDADPGVAAARLFDTLARPLKRRVERSLSKYASEDAVVILRVAAEVAVIGGQVEEFARLFGVCTETLINWCDRAHLPPPRKLLVWMRVLLGALLLEDAGRSIESAAAGCGYATDRSLRRVMQQLLGSDPRTLQGPRAFDEAAAAFNRELRRQRVA